MNLLLFIIVIIISFVIVRIGAVAFELTGLEWSLAKFQALSCFSGTGFTTREAELVTGHPQRRKIATILMVLGNAGLVTLIATFANTIRPRVSVAQLSTRFKIEIPPGLLPWVNLLLIVLAGYVIYRVFSHTRTLQKLTDYVRARLRKSDIVQQVSFEQLMVATGGYGVIGVTVSRTNPLVGKILRKSGLREHDITVLVIERKDETTANPPPDMRVMAGDRLVCFGKLDVIRDEFGEDSAAAAVAEAGDPPR